MLNHSYKPGFILISIFFSLTLVECENVLKKKIKNGNNNNFQKNKKIQNHYQRNLEDDDSIPFNIYLDLHNFNHQFPENLINSKNLIINSMNKAKKTLESLLRTYDYGDSTVIPLRYEEILSFGIERYNESLFVYEEQDTIFLKYMLNDFKVSYTIFFKFSDSKLEEDDIASAQIIYSAATPKLGLITLKNNIPSSKLTSKYLEPLMLHLFTHLLGFQSNDKHDIDTMLDENASKFYISTNNVLEYAKNYFGDTEIDKIEILKDEKGNLHWPSRILLGEYMTKYDYPEELAISGFTLAFLEDLEYYKIIGKYTGGLMRFGKNKGKDFLDKKCVNNDGIQFKNEFYYPTIPSGSDLLSVSDPSCTSGRQSKTIYKFSSYKDSSEASTIPSDYQYYPEDDSIGGFISANYCPVSQSISVDKYSDRCSETGKSNSFCALSSLKKTSTNNDETYQAECFEMFCSKKSLTIKIEDYYFVCPREGGKIDGDEGFSGFLLCPDYNLICTGNVTCNDMFDCVEKKSVEIEESFIYNGDDGYQIETTQVSSEYKSDNTKRGWEISQGSDSKCPYLCSKCKLNGECVKCGTNNKLENKVCVPKIPNCEEYEENEECKKCKDDYVFIDGDKTSCNSISELGNNQYFVDPDNNKNYKKCSTAINNCEQCTDSTHCIKCKTNFAIIDETNPSECVDISNNEYYLDENNKYKSCSSLTDLGNCKKCLKNNDNIINCIECADNTYSLLHKDIVTCILKSDIENQNNDNIFTFDDGLNYYLCSNNLYHSVENCLKCHNKDLCDSCQIDYELANSNKLCLLKSDLLSQRYYLDNTDNNYYLCSDKIKGCEKCTDSNTCIKCNDEYGINENNKCIHISTLLSKYYFDSSIGKYKSCTNIENCEECISEQECTKCQNGYELNKESKVCEKDSNNNNAATLAKVAIALSCIAIGLSLAVILLLLYNKFFKKPKNNENITLPQENNNEENGVNEVVIQSKKRSIHNTGKQSNELIKEEN